MATPTKLPIHPRSFLPTPPDTTPRNYTSQYNSFNINNVNSPQARRPLGLGQSARHRRGRKILRDNIAAAINKPVVRRLARRGGVRRIQQAIYETTQQVVRSRLEEILKCAITICEYTGRKTLTSLDVVYALRHLGNPIYGFGTVPRGENIHSRAQYMRDKRVRERKAAAEYAAKFDAEQREREAREAREARNRNVDIMERAMRAGARRW